MLLLGFSVLIVGCAHATRTKQAPETIPDSGEMTESGVGNRELLLHREWVLVSMGPIGSEESVGDAATITLEFTEDDRLHGSAGCNRYFGGYELGAGNSLSIGNTGSTMMMCPEEIMNWEVRYLRALENISSYRIENNRLLLFTEEEEEVLVFAHKQSAVQSETDTEKEPTVESSREIPFDSMNHRVRTAADRGGSWVQDPIRIALEFRNVTEARIVTIKRVYESGEGPDSAHVTIVEDGYADDSVRGMWTRLAMIKLDDGTWRITEAHTAYRCRRGDHRDTYAAEPCP
jgi:heat shock protein HslJ